MVMKTKLKRPGLLWAALLPALLMCGPVNADEFDDLRAKWLARTSIAPKLPPGDPDVAMQVTSSANNTQAYWDNMIRTEPRAALWPDLPVGTGTPSANIATSVARLQALANAYKSSSQTNFYQKPEVKEAVRLGMDWLITNVYTETGTGYDNWWHWQIGTPLNITGLIMSFYDHLDPVQIPKYLAAIHHYSSDPTRRAAMNGSYAANAEIETGANRLDKALISVLCGILDKSESKISAGAGAISQALAWVTTGDGFYRDGSFIQHGSTPYIGGYGTVLLGDIIKLYYILNNTRFSIASDPNYNNPFEWAMNAFRPFIYDGAVMNGQRGRSVSREFASNHFNGRQIVTSLAELAYSLPPDQALALKGVVKGWAQRDTSFGSSYYTPVQSDAAGTMSGVNSFGIALIKGAVNDPAVPSTPEPLETRYYASADRAVSRGQGYGFELSMFSPRISSFEYGNGEHKNAWWTGIGMTNLHNADQTQYGNNFWATVDMWRLPGTTTDRSGTGTPVAWKAYYNTKNLVGGAELNRQFATAAMDFGVFNVTGKTLTGKKAWFMFGNSIVAVGSGINSTDGVKVETIVDNRALNSAGDNTLTVNAVGNAKLLNAAPSENMAATNWAHLQGNTATGSDIGYVFPDAPTVAGLRETRAGSWRNINTGGTTTVYNKSFLSLALDHGTSPSNASYTYIVLPNRTAQETADFASANPIKVLERSTAATAVRDVAQGVTGVVFWNDSAKTVNVNGQPYLSSDKKAVVTLQQVGADLQLAVSDPTQQNTGTIMLEFHRAATVVSVDPAITVTQTSPTLKMTVDVNASAGKSFKAQLSVLPTTTTLTPVADGFVRDGTYASTNYGATTNLTIKQDALGYARKAAIKFDLSSINGPISSAVLTMKPTWVGTATGMVHNLYQTQTDSWTESGLTWNSMPAKTGLLGGWTVPAAYTPVTVDLTGAASGVVNGSKLLSLALESAANYGSGGGVDYGSKENATAANRPTLVITSH